MIKKYKKCLGYTVISILILMLVGIVADKVVAANTSSEENFLKAKADSLIGKSMYSSSPYEALRKKGNAACFYHKEGNKNNVNSHIHSVYDMTFDKNKGEMKVYSVKEKSDKSTTSKTTYASSKNGKHVGRLAANAIRDKNSYVIWVKLKEAIADKAVVNESAIVGGKSAWGGNELFGGSGNTSIERLSNPASEKTIAEYQNYRMLKKVELKDSNNKANNPKENGKTFTKSGKSFTVIGPFKMTFGGKSIESIKVGNAVRDANTKGQIFYKTSNDLKADNNNWESGWREDFNRKESNNSTVYVLNDQTFYLAVETSKLPDSGNYKVVIQQHEFKYYNSRIAVTVGNAAQQMGMYCYDKNQSTVHAKISWTVARNALKTLVINKKDATTNKNLKGAGFKVYAVLKDGTKGWVSGSADGTKTYGNKATEYAEKVQIKKLRVGTYYIYETKAPNGYSLTDQKGYHKKAEGSDSLTGDWVYVGKKTLANSDSKVAVAVTNIPQPGIQIVKKDSKTDKELSGAKFKLYGEFTDGSKGWVSGAVAGAKTIGETADEYETNTNIQQLKYGTYYIYETKAPEGYSLSNQTGYHTEAPGSTSLTGDWVFIQKLEVNDSNPHVEVVVKNETSPEIEIVKKDSKTDKELSGAKFKLYGEFTDGTAGWVSGSANADKTFGENADEYDSNVQIQNLRYGTYYVYETKAPEGYALASQKGYHTEAPGSKSLTGDWVYVQKLELNDSNSQVQVVIKNETSPEIEIVKKDSKTGEELTGAKFKLYGEFTDGTAGWVSGAVNADKTFGENADEYDSNTKIEKLRYGTYYIYETTAPEGYLLANQKGYHSTAPGSDSLTGDWVYLDKVELNDSNAKIQIELENIMSPSLIISKKDSTTQIDLDGAKFKLYGVYEDGTKGWVSGPVDGAKTFGQTADEYDSNTKIEQLKYGTYYIYETKTPEGYDITKQDGYKKTSEGSSDLSGDWAYVGNQTLGVNLPDDGTFKFEAVNKKIIDSLEGDVWVDEPDTKANATDNVYNSSSKDYLKEGIEVNLYDGNGTLLATTTTDSKGHYEFKQKNSPSYTGTDKNIYYWDLASAYVEFVYNNKTYYNDDGTVKEYGFVTVDPFVGTDVKVNSKAQEYTVTKEKLNDDNLGKENSNPGRAVTNKDAVIKDTNQLLEKNKEISGKINNNTASEADLKDIPLACYYDNTTYKVSHINLGLLEQYDPDFSVDETLAYIKVKMKGYTYTYKYGDAAVTTSTNVPTVNEQNSAKTFTGKIYPTDIAYDVANSTNELQVYVVYSVEVKNLETMYVDNIYTEQRLYLDSLVNRYDTARYELCNSENTSDKPDFALWKDEGNGVASYDVNNENSVYKNGMAKQESKTSYIQYKIKHEALRKILEKSLTYEDIENAPTVATATGYHEYLRTDNAWVHSDSVRAFDGAKGTNIYPTTSDSGKKYYVHKSVNKDRSSADLYLKLSLGEPRKVSGTVFEDTKTEQSASEGTSVGNGIMDDSEANRAENVVVELLNADKTTVSKLYQEKDGKVVYDTDGNLPEARTNTPVGGNYEFEGVVPGYYYIRFTYGDGTQKLMPADTAIKSNDYKSTIINTETNGAGDIIKNAMEAKAEDLQNAQSKLPAEQTEAQKKLVEWYKYLNNTNYSTAVDDTDQRMAISNYVYGDNGEVYNQDGTKVEDYPTNVNSYTPMVGISIENDINDSTENGDEHKSNYEGFNFGIIAQPNSEIVLNKKITNVKLTTQTGTTLVSANPTDKSAQYISALDQVTGGSKQAKVELEQNLIYGTALETTYQIEVENNSEKDYIEEQDSDEFGHYYKYGEITRTSQLKKITVNEIIDELDPKYNYNSEEKITSRVENMDEDGNEATTENTITVTKTEPDGTTSTQTTTNLSMTGWSSLTSGYKETMSYTVTSLLSDQNDSAFENKAKVTSLSVDKLSTLKSNFEWGLTKDSTALTITPPTGSDRRATYWVAGTLGLIVIACGIVFLKRKVLKK